VLRAPLGAPVSAGKGASPECLIRAIQPDILAKGGDYRKSQIAGADFVEAHGSQVIILDYIDGASTTIIDAIHKPN